MKRLGEVEAYLCRNLNPLSSPNTKSLLSASTTINTNLSNGASGPLPSVHPILSSHPSTSYLANPSIKGLYGKKPVAKTRIATGIKRFASARRIDLPAIMNVFLLFLVRQKEHKGRLKVGTAA